MALENSIAASVQFIYSTAGLMDFLSVSLGVVPQPNFITSSVRSGADADITAGVPNDGPTQARTSRWPGEGQTPGAARLPDGWQHLRILDVMAELNLRVRTLKKVPKCIRGAYLRIMTQSMVAVESAHRRLDRGRAEESECEQAWSLFLMLPRLLLHSTRRGGAAGDRDLKRRVALFDAGHWDKLMELSRQAVAQPTSRAPMIEEIRIA
jgi:hypothetical protein